MQPKILIYSNLNYISGLNAHLNIDTLAVTEVHTQEDFTKMSQNNSYDLAIIDSNIEDHLFELSELIRSSSMNSEVPLLLISTKKIGLKKTFPGYDTAPILFMTKPYAPKDLQNSTIFLIKFKKQRDELIAKNVALQNSIDEINQKTKQIENQKIQLFNQAHLSSLGEMAGGIAHEINNPLAIIKSSTHFLKKNLAKGTLDNKTLGDVLEDIETTVTRISKIINGMRNLARNTEEFQVTKTTLNAIFNDILSLCRERFKNHGISLIIDHKLDNQDFCIECDQVQVSQVLINLLSNAFDAIETLSDKWIKILINEDAQIYTIDVIDSGLGIPSKIEEKIFNPFFTSKEIGKGTGLGLSISKSILEKHGGSIEIVHPSPNTNFRIKIPKKCHQKSLKVS